MKISANNFAALLLGVSAMGWSAGVPQASAQSYPSRNITAISRRTWGDASCSSGVESSSMSAL